MASESTPKERYHNLVGAVANKDRVKAQYNALRNVIVEELVSNETQSTNSNPNKFVTDVIARLK